MGSNFFGAGYIELSEKNGNTTCLFVLGISHRDAKSPLLALCPKKQFCRVLPTRHVEKS